MALKRIVTETRALDRTLDSINRRLQGALFDNPSGTGQRAQQLQAERAAIKARQPSPA